MTETEEQIRTEILNRIGEQKSLSESTAATVSQMQRQIDSIDAKLQGGNHGVGGGGFTKSLIDRLKEEPSFERLIKERRGVARISFTGSDAAQFNLKTTITSDAVGRMTTGVLPIERLPGITEEARQQLTIRALLASSPTTFQVIDFVKVNTPMVIASQVAEASTKPENAVAYTTVSERGKTIATWIPASRQVLDDMAELAAAVAGGLTYYLNLCEKQQLLSGDGTGENLHGLIGQASSFNSALLNPARGWNKIDVIGRAIQQISAAKELQPTFIVLHPTDWWDIRLTKDQYGHYILGDPQQGGVMTASGFALSPTQNIFGLTAVPTTSIAQGTFLIGSGNREAAEIRDRVETMVEVSSEHQDFFVKNLVAIRAEKRLALITRRPAAFVTGSFSTSP
jgi:HK97 family phage major capsid protein